MNLKTSKQIFNLNFIKMKKLLFYVVIAFAILSSSGMMAQQGFGTNTPDKSAAVDIVSTKRGLLIPRVALTETTNNSPVNSPATSLMVYNTASANDVTPGFYYWDGAKWVRFMDTDSDHTTSVVAGQGIIVTPDTTDPNNTEYTVSVAPGASEEMVLVTIEDPANPGEFITEWVSYADFLDDLIAADNGLFYDATTGTVELGGTLNRDTKISTGANQLEIDATGGVFTLTGIEAWDNDPAADDALSNAKIVVLNADGTMRTIDYSDSIYTADNGLTMTGNNVQLGGDLIQATTITTDENTMTIATDAVGTLAITGLEAADAANKIVVTDATTGVLRTVLRSISDVANNTDLSVDTIADYSPYVPEINVAVTLVGAADVDITLPAVAAAKGQVINIRITNSTDAHDGYCNILLPGGGTLTYGAMPYQGWIIKSDGSNWVVVGRN
jgi:hypothetical protein